MSPTLATFLFELVNFLLLVALLGWILFRPVREALEARVTAERQRSAALATQEASIADARAELDKRRASFDDETAKLRRDRLATAETEAAAIVAGARETADRERERSLRTLAHLEHAQVERLSHTVAAATRETISHLLATLETGDLDAALVRVVCHQLDSARGAILVESAGPLDQQSRAEISKAVDAHTASLEFRVVPELGAGLRVTTPRGLIDASAAGLAAHAERALNDALSRAGAQTEA